jgi:hypothetical protein
MANKTKDEIVQQLLGVVAEKKAEIAAAEKPNWKTNKSFRYSEESSKSLNLNTVNTTIKLVEALSHLLEKEKSYSEAAKLLGYSGEFTWFGYSVADWKADFITRNNQIGLIDMKKDLEIKEAKLDKLVSKEVREAMELEQLQKELLG